jgi:FKBP-type peptidyl-prolyl cis-trans isomerase FklB
MDLNGGKGRSATSSGRDMANNFASRIIDLDVDIFAQAMKEALPTSQCATPERMQDAMPHPEHRRQPG